MDGITVGQMYQLNPGDPLVMGPAQRMDVLVKAGAPGTYTLEAEDPSQFSTSVSPYRSAQDPKEIDPALRLSMHSADFPLPCTIGNAGASPTCANPNEKPPSPQSYPIILATIKVSGPPVAMKLPTSPLPVPAGLPSVDTMLNRTPDAVRHVAFELCGNRPGTSQGPEHNPSGQLPDCGWYFAKYGAEYWGGLPFNDLMMLRDDDDKGTPTSNPDMPLINFQKEGLFDPNEPLFSDMIAGNYEEWTVINRSFSDHPFHIHQNHFLVTKINDTTLPIPEWHDTINVPGAVSSDSPVGIPLGPTEPPFNAPFVNLNDAQFGSITFRMYLNPVTVGCLVMHCHTLNHEDIGMMQRLDILPAPGQPSGCVPETMAHGRLPFLQGLFAGIGKFQICSGLRQSQPIRDRSIFSTDLSLRRADTGQ
jgi:FtsP/CotA-like multicopper oxidase with cupredoxin domain